MVRLKECHLDLERQKQKQYGCLEGVGGIPRVYLQSSALRKGTRNVPGTKKNSYVVKGLRADLTELSLQLLYDQAKVFALHAGRLELDAKAEFVKSELGPGVLPGIDVELRYERLVVQVCRETVPTLRRISQRLSTSEAASVLTRKASELPTLQRTHSSRLDARLPGCRQDDDGDDQDDGNGKESAGKVGLSLQIEGVVSGSELHVTLFATERFDDDCVHLTLRELQKLRLSRMLDRRDLFHSLQIALADCILFKVDKGLLPDIPHLSVARLRGASGQYIVSFPDMSLDLDTVQTLDNRLGSDRWHITWDLLSDFKNPIDISPDLAVYAFLKRVLTEEYASSMASGLVSSPVAASAAPDKPAVQYKLNLFELHPKFGPLGDMTPDVSKVLGWVSKEKGKQDQDRICDALRAGVVESMERACQQLAAAMDMTPPRRPPGIAWGEKMTQVPQASSSVMEI